MVAHSTFPISKKHFMLASKLAISLKKIDYEEVKSKNVKS